MKTNLKPPYPYSENTAEFMDMAGQARPQRTLLSVGQRRTPSPGDLGTLQGLQNAAAQVVGRIRHPVLRLRLALLLEEIIELSEGCLHEDIDLIARNVADALYVAHSFPHSLGYDGAAVYECVHECNMRKRMGKVRSDGKQLAPADFKPPDVRAILKKAGGEQTPVADQIQGQESA